MSALHGFEQRWIDAAGVTTRVFVKGNSGAPATMFLHGGIPGLTPYCSGAHIWGHDCLTRFKDRVVIAQDLPGSGATRPGSGPVTVEMLANNIMAVLTSLSLDSVDVIGHDLGGLLGIWMALNEPARVRSLSIVASPMSPPNADGLDPILFTSAPTPLWTRDSQAWTLERLSLVHTHIDSELLETCTAAGLGDAHLQATESMTANWARVVSPGIARIRSQLWSACRNQGLQVPAQIVWASNDPATSIESGRVLFNAIAARQTATQMHVINRSGHFPFREQPDAFHYIVASFADGVLRG